MNEEPEEAELLESESAPAEEAVILRDFSETVKVRDPRLRRIALRVAGALVVLLLAVILIRALAAPENTPESELTSTRAEARANLGKATRTLRDMEPTRSQTAADISISLEEKAGVPVGLGAANEPGEVGVSVRRGRVFLEADTGRRTLYRSVRLRSD